MRPSTQPSTVLPPHRVLGLLDYALTQYRHTITTDDGDV